MHSEVAIHSNEIGGGGFRGRRISQDELDRYLEKIVQIVGIEAESCSVASVHTIDIWYSQRRGAWVVERLNAEGSQIGASFACGSEAEAADCLEDWVRAHHEVHLVAPRETTAAERRVLSKATQARAA